MATAEAPTELLRAAGLRVTAPPRRGAGGARRAPARVRRCRRERRARRARHRLDPSDLRRASRVLRRRPRAPHRACGRAGIARAAGGRQPPPPHLPAHHVVAVVAHPQLVQCRRARIPVAHQPASQHARSTSEIAWVETVPSSARTAFTTTSAHACGCAPSTSSTATPTAANSRPAALSSSVGASAVAMAPCHHLFWEWSQEDTHGAGDRGLHA